MKPKHSMHRKVGSSRIMFLTLIFIVPVFISGAVLHHNSPSTTFQGIIPSQAIDPLDLDQIMPNQTCWFDPDIECLIITTAALSPEFQPLANLKTSRGVFTEILTIESIYSNTTFTTGANDNAESIRNAIKHYHENKGTEFVIIGGDVDVVPIRYTYNPDISETRFNNGDYYDTLKPTDQYYAGLNGTWDDDGDGLYGEMNLHNDNNTDEVDWDAEVFVGRLPVHDASEANTLISKIIDYELSPPTGDWFSDSIFAGAVSQFAYGQYSSVDEAELSDFMISNYFSSMDPTRLYFNTSDYSPVEPFTTLSWDNLRSAWNQGASVLNLAGHGNPCSYGGYESVMGDVTYMNSVNSATLSNGGKLPFVYIYACSSGAFDLEEIGSSTPINGVWQSLAERLIRNPSGGAIAVVSGMRTTYYFEGDEELEALNRGQNRFFWREFMVNQEYQPGRTLYKSKETYIEEFINKYWNVDLNWDPEKAEDNDYMEYQEEFRKNILTYNLLGDPEMPIYTATPRNFTSGILPPTAYHGDKLLLEVTDHLGMPVSNARILINNSEYYITCTTDDLGIGTIRIPHDPALIGGGLNYTISAHNMNRTNGVITILNDTVAPVQLSGDIPTSKVSYKKPFTISATGIDDGSGIKYAFVIYVESNGSLDTFHEMTLVSHQGNSTSFNYSYPLDLDPGSTLSLYLVGYDASGSCTVAMKDGTSLYTINVKTRAMEIIMLAFAVVGIPAMCILAILWLNKYREKQANSIPLGRTAVNWDTKEREETSKNAKEQQPVLTHDFQHTKLGSEAKNELASRLTREIPGFPGISVIQFLSKWLYKRKGGGVAERPGEVIMLEEGDLQPFEQHLFSTLSSIPTIDDPDSMVERYMEAIRNGIGMAVWKVR
ncbi:hypothetical protein GF325_14545 [Candidatus Bathyarchaeota archaeon]|nr:hypothetical protein [Candidatus Bathyarchaeota archaeon]